MPIRLNRFSHIPQASLSDVNESFIYEMAEVRGNLHIRLDNSDWIFGNIHAVFVFFELRDQLSEIVNGHIDGTLNIDSEPQIDYVVDDGLVRLRYANNDITSIETVAISVTELAKEASTFEQSFWHDMEEVGLGNPLRDYAEHYDLRERVFS